MPIQVLEAGPQKRTFGQKLGVGFQQALGVLGAHQQQEKQFSRQMQLEEAKQSAKYKAQQQMLQELGLMQPRGQEFPQEREQSFGDKISPNGEIDIGNVKIPSLIPQDKIFAASLVNPALADKMQKQNDIALQQSRHQEEMEFKRLKEDPEHKRETELSSAQAKADIDYNKDLQSSFRQHELKKSTLGKLENLNNKGVTGKPYEKWLEKLGLVNLTSEGRREFAADVKNLITDIRSILGAQFTGFEFQTILNAYPSADFSQDANRAIINNLKEFEDIRGKEFEYANQIKKENGGKIPADFQSRVNERVQEYAQSKLPVIKENTRRIMNEEYGIPPGHILMFDPNGEPLSVSDENIDQYLELGATLP